MHISLPSCVVEAQHNNMIKVKLFQFNCFCLASSHFLADDCHAWMSLQYFPLFDMHLGKKPFRLDFNWFQSYLPSRHCICFFLAATFNTFTSRTEGPNNSRANGLLWCSIYTSMIFDHASADLPYGVLTPTELQEARATSPCALERCCRR